MDHAAQSSRGNLFESFLEALGVVLDAAGSECERIPDTGALVVAANHPTGLLDGAVAAALCLRRRADVRILINHLLPVHEALEPYLIRVDPYGRRESAAANRIPLRRAVGWLRRGGCLVVFPAGEVSRLDWKHWGVADPEWSPSVARLIRLGRADALPLYIRASNSPAFHLLGAVHPRLKTLRLPAELLNKRGARVEVRVGMPVPFSRLAALDDRSMAAHLQARNILLGKCSLRPAPAPPCPAPAAPAVCTPPDALDRALAQDCLVETRDWAVTRFRGAEDPALMEIIGRLREAAFREAGEGTGSDLDIDAFDPHYDQLVLWNLADRAPAGGYRICATADVLPRLGPQGLYTSTLFRFHPDFFRRLGPAAELGRSFIAPCYQKLYMPLLLLWQAIGVWIRRRPECRRLFGPVSISASYQDVSRLLLSTAMLETARHPELAPLVKPRRPLRHREARAIRNEWRRLRLLHPEQISELIAALEPDGKGMPVLLRQYLRLGGRVLAFNVDPHFSNALDALIVVDLLETDRPLLDRYLGREGAEQFLAFHRAAAPVRRAG
ncbi:MAG: lysophospholipid acyltransferase family protein [Bryobacteraceae bacterium]|nr:lysophospholipid acyltransferase family protein [Bryobacteraceae bacterium]